MTQELFPEIPRIGCGQSDNPLEFKFFKPDEQIDFGSGPNDLWAKTRRCVAIWHLLGGSSGDPFGPPTHLRPWNSVDDPDKWSDLAVDGLFELTSKLSAAYRWVAFHDYDLIKPANTLRKSNARLDRAAERMAQRQNETGVHVMWGTSNLFSHPRYQNGAVVSPDREVYEYALGQCRKALEVTHHLGGLGFVFWGGRNGYIDLMGIRLQQARDQLGRFLRDMVDFKHKIGFKGWFAIEPKAREPMNHQYDFDVATTLGFLADYGLEDEFGINFETNHGWLATHSAYHEMETARAADALLSVDLNQGTIPEAGWDTDEYLHDPLVALQLALPVVQQGGLYGGFNVDAKPRRSSNAILDWVIGHIVCVDALTVGFRAAAWLERTGKLNALKDTLHASWDDAEGKRVLSGKTAADKVAERALDKAVDRPSSSGRVEEIWQLELQALAAGFTG